MMKQKAAITKAKGKKRGGPMKAKKLMVQPPVKMPESEDSMEEEELVTNSMDEEPPTLGPLKNNSQKGKKNVGGELNKFFSIKG